MMLFPKFVVHAIPDIFNYHPLQVQ